MKNPNNNDGIYGVVHFKNLAIGILPIDNEGNTWLVGQYRFPLERYSWELPEGGGKLDGDPIESAQRELLEETGLVAKTWNPLLEMHLSNSVSDEAAIVYLATDLTQETACPEDSEELIIKKLPFSEALNMVLNGEITDSISVAAILKYHYIISKT